MDAAVDMQIRIRYRKGYAKGLVIIPWEQRAKVISIPQCGLGFTIIRI
jgi:hypothetical protein